MLALHSISKHSLHHPLQNRILSFQGVQTVTSVTAKSLIMKSKCFCFYLQVYQ